MLRSPSTGDRNGEHAIHGSLKVTDGDAGWPIAEALDKICYPPEVMAKVIWRDVTWAHADKRIFAYMDDKPTCHVGLYLRDGRNGERQVLIGGVGGVMTLPDMRRRGCASGAMGEAARLMREEGCDFGLLFCEPHNVRFYEKLGWRVFGGDVFCEQPTQRIRFDMMHAMTLPVVARPTSSIIDLCGLPW